MITEYLRGGATIEILQVYQGAFPLRGLVAAAAYVQFMMGVYALFY